MTLSHETDPSITPSSVNGGIPPHERAQDHIDTAVEMARAFRRRVELTVGENGDVRFEFREPNSSSPTREVPIVDFSDPLRVPNSRDLSPPKGKESPGNESVGKPPLKTHDVRGLTGFYKGVFYRDGVSQNNRKKKK